MSVKAIIDATANPAHPVWSWSKSLVVIVCVTLVLYHNASTFDETEWRAIMEIAAVVFGATGLHNWARAKRKPQSESES